MPTPLPDWNDPVDSLAGLLDASDRRLQQLRRIDPHGGFDAPFLELNTRAQVYTLLALLVFGLATLVTLIFTRGPVFLGLAGITALLLVYVVVTVRASNRHVARWRREGVVAAAAVVMANNRLFDEGNDMLPGVVVYSLDPELGRDAEGLIDLAERLFELKSADRGGMSAAVRDLADRLATEIPTWRRVRVPRELCGNDQTWMADLAFDRKRLPHRRLDRRLQLCLVHPNLDLDTTALLPLQIWWREDLDEFSQQLGQSGVA